MKLDKIYYTSANSLESGNIKFASMPEAIAKAQKELERRGLKEIGIVQIVAVVRRAVPIPPPIVIDFVED